MWNQQHSFQLLFDLLCPINDAFQITDGKPSNPARLVSATDRMRDWQRSTGTNVVRLGMGINDESSSGEITFNRTELREELRRFVQMTDTPNIDATYPLDGASEDVNSSRARVNIDFDDLGSNMAWIGRFFCLPPLCKPNEYLYSACSAFADADCRPIEQCRTGVSLAVF